MNLPAVALGALALAGLEVVLTSPHASTRLASSSAGIGKVVDRIVDPSVPAIGPATTTAAATSTSQSTRPASGGTTA